MENSQAPTLAVVKGDGRQHAERTFIDLFAGAGGLSLGLMNSGWSGMFAVEKDPMAFETLRYNLIDGTRSPGYQWPGWLPKTPNTVGGVADAYQQHLSRLRGKITMVVGGPPCQGFSLAGKRNERDARNALFKEYLRIIKSVRPIFVLVENVQGISARFDKAKASAPYSTRIARMINGAGYEVRVCTLQAADFGVAQARPRVFILATKKGIAPSLGANDPLQALSALREDFLRSKGLSTEPTTAKAALSDLETTHGVMSCVDSPRFVQGVYGAASTDYQRLMRADLGDGLPDSHRLANHRPQTVARFADILASCRRGVQLNQLDRKRLGLKKQRTVPLDPDRPSHTLTTLPDDLIHYSESRILTVREYARLQSIPDWFRFRGAYTTGGKRRMRECPRYTQVGNAVPPLLGEALGMFFAGLHDQFLGSASDSSGLA